MWKAAVEATTFLFHFKSKLEKNHNKNLNTSCRLFGNIYLVYCSQVMWKHMTYSVPRFMSLTSSVGCYEPLPSVKALWWSFSLCSSVAVPAAAAADLNPSEPGLRLTQSSDEIWQHFAVLVYFECESRKSAKIMKFFFFKWDVSAVKFEAAVRSGSFFIINCFDRIVT